MSPDAHSVPPIRRIVRLQAALLRYWPALVGLAAGALFFSEVLLSGRVYYPGDLARGYLPMRVALARALGSARFPWWVADLGAGYPLLAEGEVGALYPLNWLTTAFFAPATGLTASIVSHYAIAGIGAFVLLRAVGRSRGAALFGSLVATLGGFLVAHLSHYAVLATACWLPWLLTGTHRLVAGGGPPARLWRWGAGLAVAVALQFLAGHAQVSLLALVYVGAYALYLAAERVLWSAPRPGRCRRLLAAIGPWAGALAAGTLLALPQILPSIELSALSQRAGGLAGDYFTSYSFHPLLGVTFLAPFALGNPYPSGSVEVMGYVGLLPLALAALALGATTTGALRRVRSWRSGTGTAGNGLRREDRETLFLAAMAALGLLMALGRWNPAYALLEHVPVLNLFRVPARYLLWVSWSLAALAAAGLDALLARRKGTGPGRGEQYIAWGVGLAGLAVLGAASLANGVDGLIALWRWLPAVLAVSCAGVLWLGRRHSREGVPLALAILVLLADLYAYGVVLDGTFSTTAAREWVEREPDVVAFLQEQDSVLMADDAGPYRVYTKEEILPAASVQRASLYPNVALAHGVQSANVYMPLVPATYQAYLDGLTAERLDRLNVRYYLIPQLLPVDEASELYDVMNPFAALPVNTWLAVPETEVAAVEVESYLSHAVDLADGELVAEILLRDAAGRTWRLPIRAGLETAEWAYERSDVARVVKHSLPALGSTWPARSGFPPEEHAGHTYLACHAVDGGDPARVVEVQILLHRPEAFVRIESVRLVDGSGEARLLAHLLNLGDHRIVYRTEDVLVYRNEDAWPRAYAVPTARAQLAGDALTLDPELDAADLLAVDVSLYSDSEVLLMSVDGS